jgi:hypothetical protein
MKERFAPFRNVSGGSIHRSGDSGRCCPRAAASGSSVLGRPVLTVAGRLRLREEEEEEEEEDPARRRE